MIPTLRVLAQMGSLQRLAPFWLAGVVAAILWASPLALLALVYGFMLQFFVEYAMHRFIYHRQPPTEQSPFNDLYRSHIGHHEFPSDPELFTGDDHWFPVRFGLKSVVGHVLALGWFLGWPEAALFSGIALFTGSVTAFAFYEYCHTLAHLNVPKGWFGQRVTQSHLRHHFNDHETVFHVSFGMGWIDRMFGTSYDRDVAKERYDPETIMSMGMDPEDLRLVTARKAHGIEKTPRRRAAG